MRSILSLLVLIGLTVNLAHCAKAKAHGYLYTPDANSASKIINQGEAGQMFNDKDLQNLISHNLGLIENPMDLTDSSKSAISKLGSKNFMSQQKLNYLFLLEGEMLQAISEDITKKVVQHKSSQFELCGEENLESCILDLLFNHNNSGALVNALEQVAKDQKVEAYYYSSDAKTSKAYSNSLLSLDRDSKGNLFIVENSLDKPYRIGMKLDQCLANIMEGGYTIDMSARTITPKDQSPIAVGQENEAEFVQYMEDMCSIYAISKLIRKENQPSLFTFYINSISKLAAVLGQEQSQVLYNIFNLAYKQFIQNVKKYYDADEISGQVMVLEHSLEKMYENRQPAEKRALSFAQIRILQNKGTTAISDVATDDTATTVIYKSVLIGFVLINLWIWAEMFQMGYSRDTIVYAKFLAADYFRR